MSFNEREQLIKGVFVTTGIVMGVLLKDFDKISDGIWPALVSMILFYSIYLVSEKIKVNVWAAYAASFVIFFVLYCIMALISS